MTELRHRILHGADEDIMDVWLNLRKRAAAADRPAGPPVCDHELRGSIQVPPPATDVIEWVAFDGDDLVGTARLEMPQQENTDLATLETLVVDPDLRGRGYGGRLLAEATRVARKHGRSRLQGTVVGERGADPENGPGGYFAGRHGAKRVYTLIHNQLVVEPRPSWWDTAWQVDRTALAVRTWLGPVPEDIVVEVAALESVLSGEGQSGDDRWEARPPAVDRLRQFERMRASRGRRAHQMVFRDLGSGQIVARGLMSVTRSWPSIGLLASGVVHPDYRRRGLGGALAAEGIRAGVKAEPEMRVLDSFNVESNHKIRQLIAALEFQELADWTVWQLDL